jgi:helix-turn-helix protein
MGRRQQPLAGEGPLVEFATALRRLRAESGLTLRQLGKRSGYSPSTLSNAEGTQRCPSWLVVEAFVQSCGGDPLDWRPRWEALTKAAAHVPGAAPAAAGAAGHQQQAGADATTTSRPGAGPSPAAGPEQASRPGPRRRPPHPVRTALAAAALAAAATYAAVLALARPATPHALTSPQIPSRAPAAGSAGALHGTGVLHSHPARPVPSGKRWISVTGPGCHQGSQSGVVLASDPSRSADGWHSAAGGWARNGCDGGAQWTLTTGQLDSWQDSATYTFTPGTPTTCAVAVYVPDTAAAGGIAYYDFYPASNLTFPHRLGTAAIDQAGHRGQWIDAGRYYTPDGVLTVMLTDRPVALHSVYPVAASGVYPVAASAIRTYCPP